ncbi:MAG: ribosome maturation factor RimP [Eubacteriales bacterium]|nr:ribosome maturation factor RimP [Eubacteriales bacterium]
MSKITDTVTALVLPIVEAAGCTLWDVEYVREAGNYYLRIFIDKEGGVSIDDCEKVSRELDPVLDEADPIPDSYVFEVGSPGAERELKRPSDFEKFIGSEIEIRTYKPVDGQKSFVGILKAFKDGDITFSDGNTDRTLTKAEIAKVRLHVSF